MLMDQFHSLQEKVKTSREIEHKIYANLLSMSPIICSTSPIITILQPQLIVYYFLIEYALHQIRCHYSQ